MKGDRWIVIPKWDDDEHGEGFQHYKDRDPKWIKVYRSLLAKDEFLMLSMHLRGILVSLWLEYAASNRQLRDSTVTLTRRLGQRVTARDLTSLNRAGFIEFSASAPLASCYPRLRSREDKKGLRKDQRGEATGGELLALKTLIANGSIRDSVDLDVELRSGDHPTITAAQREELAAMLPQVAA